MREEKIANNYVVWVIASFFAFFQFYLQAAAGVMGLEWMKDFHLDKIGLSSLSSAFFYSYALMQIPAGLLFDYYKPRYILTIAAGILTVGNFLLAYTHDYHIAYFARLLMGMGSSFGFVGLLQVCATQFPPKHFALMLGISEGFTMFFVTLGIMLLTGVMTVFSWRIAMYGASLITFILTLSMYIFIRDTHIPQHTQTTPLSLTIILQRLKIIFTNTQVLICSVYCFFMFSIVTAFASLWGVAFIINTTTFSREMAASMVAIIFIGIATGGPISGWLSKTLNNSRPVLIIASAAATVIMTSIIFWPQPSKTSLLILFFLMGLVCSAYVQCFAVIKDSMPVYIRATALASINMIIMLAAPILQLCIGWLLENHFFHLANETATIYKLSLSILPLGMFLALILAFRIKEIK